MRATSEAASRVTAIGPAGARCADVILDALERAGVDTFYGVPGGAISPLYDALVGRPHLRVIHTRHETTALFMAVGHVRMRPGTVPCVLTTSGPGVTNALTGLAAAYAEGVPVLMLSGEVPVSKFGRGALQEGSSEAVDVVSMVRTVTRGAGQLRIPSRAAFEVAAAVASARERRGPVFLSIPLDVATAMLEPRFLPHALSQPVVEASLDALEEASAALRGASHPLLLLGAGARGASAEVRALAERLNCPVITSPKAKGVFDESDPRCLGVFGYGGHRSALDRLLGVPSDVILAIGCGLGEVSTNSWSQLVQATETFIQVDLDAGQFGRNYRTDIALWGDAQATTRALLALLLEPSAPPTRPEERSPNPVLAGITYLAAEDTECDSIPLAPARVLTVLQEELPEDTVYTADIGEHLLFAIHYLRIRRPDQFIAALSLGSMGSGIGAAVGAKAAAPERPVVAICGDYGWQMYGMDLHTCLQERIGVVFVIMNDSRMRMVEAGIERIYGRGLPMDGPLIDFAGAARAHGAEGYVVSTVEELREALAAPTDGVPRVLDVRIDASATFPMNARVAEISNFVVE